MGKRLLTTWMMESMLRLITVSFIFLAGVTVGWVVHDWQIESGARTLLAGKSTEHPPHESQVSGVADTDTNSALFKRGDIPAVVNQSAGDPSVITALIGDTVSPDASELLRGFMARYGKSIRHMILLARIESELGSHQSALSVIIEADLLAKTPTQQALITSLLAAIVDAYARSLLATNSFDAVDQLYERITFAMPEQAQFFLKLGQLRISLGNYDEALAPLSQIENHARYGALARELIDQGEVQEPLEHLEVLPLESNGSQFVVEATIDRQHRVRLLVDTGAAMTVLDDRVFQRLGYNLEGKPRGLFSTANGVVEAPIVSVGHLALGRAGIGPMPVGALHLSIPDNVEGLLGMNFLRHYNFRIDSESSELLLESTR